MAKHKAHHWVAGSFVGGKGSTSRLPWRLCLTCGLLELKNETSRKAAQASCPGKED